jgi:hypothetical protein
MPLKITDPVNQATVLNKWAAEIENKLNLLHGTANQALTLAQKVHAQVNKSTSK